jgi:hypothetical protein
LIFRHRGNHNYLSYAIQLGTFVKNIAGVPQVVINYICKQLNIDIKEVSSSINNRSLWIHSQEIRKAYGYSDFSDQPMNFRLARWLYTRAWLTSERSSILFDLATAKCVEEKILLPGVTVMARLIAKIKDRTNKRLFTKLSNLPDKNQLNIIENLIEFDTKRKKTPLDILRTPPRNVTAGGILKAISRIEELRLLESKKWNLSGIPFGKIETLARYASMARAQTISQMNYDRKIATLVAFTIVFTKNAQDDVIDIMEQLFTKLFNKSVRKEQKSRIRTIKDLDSAARKLKDACALLLDESLSTEDIRETIFSSISKEDLKGALNTVDKLTKNPKQSVASKELFSNYSTIRRFLPKLFMVLEFKSTSSGESVLNSWNFLASIESKKGKNKYANAPLDRITESWKKLVVKSSNDKINPCAYTFWVIEKVLESLKNRDIFIEYSCRYGDPRAQLLQGDEWKAIKPNILRTLNLPIIPEEKINSLSKELDSLYKEVANRWPNNPNARIETFDGHDRLIVTPLDRLPESESLKWLRKSVQLSIPHIDLPELVLELNSWTNFTEAFTHISEGNSKLNDLHISICALLISRACNIGLEPVVQPGMQALEYDRLTWVNQNYFRSETIKINFNNNEFDLQTISHLIALIRSNKFILTKEQIQKLLEIPIDLLENDVALNSISEFENFGGYFSGNIRLNNDDSFLKFKKVFENHKHTLEDISEFIQLIHERIMIDKNLLFEIEFLLRNPEVVIRDDVSLHGYSNFKKSGAVFALYIDTVIMNIIDNKNKIKIELPEIELKYKENNISGNNKYDIALSFAGEDRATAKKLADSLERKGINVFYDHLLDFYIYQINTHINYYPIMYAFHTN